MKIKRYRVTASQIRSFCQGCILASLCLFPTASFADCVELSSNDVWMSNIRLLKSQIENGEFAEAIKTSEMLYDICRESPTLLYYTGLAFRGLGDEERATVYFQKSSEAISEMSVEPGIGRLIWYTRYEAENPGSKREEIEQREALIQQQQVDLNEKQLQLTELQHELDTTKILLTEAKGMVSVEEFEALMWTGVGIGAAGIVMTIVGGTMLGLAEPEDRSDVDNVAVGAHVSIKNGYVAEWAVLGVGIGLSLAGAAMAGFGGYLYSHVGSDETPSSGADLSFNVGPGSAGMTVVF